MYVIEGYLGAQHVYYDEEKNEWKGELLKAKFYNTMLEAQYTIDGFQFNENDYVKAWRGRKYEKAGPMISYITPQFYSDDDIAKKMLLLQ